MECPNKVKVVLGAQWGDEGKGKLVDLLAEHADVVARCQVSKQFFYPNNITLQKCEVQALWLANRRAFIFHKIKSSEMKDDIKKRKLIFTFQKYGKLFLLLFENIFLFLFKVQFFDTKKVIFQKKA